MPRIGLRLFASPAAAFLLSACAATLVPPEDWRAQPPPSPAAASYYLEIAFGSEYRPGVQPSGQPRSCDLPRLSSGGPTHRRPIGLRGPCRSGAPHDDRIRTWEDDLRVRVRGPADDQDLAEVDRVIRELNELAGRAMIRRVESGENAEVLFTDQSGFDRYAPRAARKGTGYVHIWWNASYTIYQARVLIRTEGIPRKRRRHVIREEITQGLGLLMDSWSYPDSIFYQGYSDVTEYSTLDREVIRLHLASRALTGATRSQVRRLLAPLSSE